MMVKLENNNVIYLGPKNEDAIWGEVQFPHCYELPDGNLGLQFHCANDSWVELLSEPKAVWMVSENKGKSWRLATQKEKDSMGTKLPNGDCVRIVPNNPDLLEGVKRGPYGFVSDGKIKVSPWYFATKRTPTDNEIVPPKPEDDKTLPRPITTFKDVFESHYYVFWLDTIPDNMTEKRFCFNRFKYGAEKSEKQYVLPEWKYRLALGFFDGQGNMMLENSGLYQCRDIKVAPDGSLYIAHYAMYGKGSNPFTGLYEYKACAYIFKSEDNGYSWKVHGYIPYKYPDEEKDKFANLECGFLEPDIEFMPDGSMLCILRTCDVFWGAPEWGPTYLSHSYDGGKTWTTPEYFTDRGALPKLCQLKNGVTLAVITRPGIYVYASDDCGKTWKEKIEVMTDKDRSKLANVVPETPDFHQWCGSCCNCYIKAIDDNRALLFYTDFYVPDENGVKRKGVKSIEIVVEK